jgi:hypothetical protein
MRSPAHKWGILSLSWAALSVIFFFAFRTVPVVGTWLGWAAGALPTALVLPFIIAEARRDRSVR